MMTLPTLGLLVTLVAQAPPATAEETFEKIQRRRWTKFYTAEAKKYEFSGGKESKQIFKWNPKSVLRWANPLRSGKTHGDLFVWTHQGRPMVVGTIFSYERSSTPGIRTINHSFHSLSLFHVTGTKLSKRFWSVQTPGIDSKPVSSAPVPAKKRFLRLSQLRAIARQFSVETTNRNATSQLRLLPQPIYRFEENDAHHDGALFVFVAGTDPELVMLIETRDTKEGRLWHYAMGTFTDLPGKAEHKGRTVWKFEGGHPRDKYISVHNIARMPAVIVE